MCQFSIFYCIFITDSDILWSTTKRWPHVKIHISEKNDDGNLQHNYTTFILIRVIFFISSELRNENSNSIFMFCGTFALKCLHAFLNRLYFSLSGLVCELRLHRASGEYKYIAEYSLIL